MVEVRRARSITFCLTVLAVASTVFAEEPKTSTGETAPAPNTNGDITLELIMSDPDWIGNRPRDPYWADDGEAIYFEQKRQGEQQRDLFRVDLASDEQAVVADEDRSRVDAPGGDLSGDRRLKVYARHGDVFVKNLTTGASTQLTRTAAPETEPFFMAGDDAVAFKRGSQVFVRDLVTGLELQAADLRLEDDPHAEDEDEDEDEEFLAAQQLRLFDVVRERKRDEELEREVAKRRQKADPSRPPLPFFLGDDLEIRQQALSPTGDAMLLVVIDSKRDDGLNDQMPAWVTDSGYVTTREVRAKVGTADGSGERLLLLDLIKHEQHEIDLATCPVSRTIRWPSSNAGRAWRTTPRKTTSRMTRKATRKPKMKQMPTARPPTPAKTRLSRARAR